MRNQIKRLRDQKPQIIVATPGRLAELVFQLRKLRLGMVRAVVIDEVDSMLKEPFIGEILTIIEATAMFKKDSKSDYEIKKEIEKQAESGSFGYQSGIVDDNDDRYNDDDDDDIDLDNADDDDEEEEVEEEEEVDEENEIPSHLNKRLVCLASATVNDPAVRAFAEKYCSPGWARVVVPSASMLPAGQ